MSFFLSKALAASIAINTNVPGLNNASSSVGGFIVNFYNFALLISGTLAFAMIVYAGVRYALAQGNPTKQGDARSMITNALLGLLLLAGAYVILYTINPNILNLQNPALPGLSPVATNTSAPTSLPGSTQASCDSTCYLPNTCVEGPANYWNCKGPNGSAPVAAGTVATACPPNSQNTCNPPNVCKGTPTLTTVIYSCVPPPTPTPAPGTTVICKGSNAQCKAPMTCQPAPEVAPGWETCEIAP